MPLTLFHVFEFKNGKLLKKWILVDEIFENLRVPVEKEDPDGEKLLNQYALLQTQYCVIITSLVGYNKNFGF